MRPLWCVTLAATLAGCQEADEQPARAATVENSSPDATLASPAPDVGPPPDGSRSAIAPDILAGEYRVAGIDGEPLNADFGIALSITDERISYDPECAGFVWNYTYYAGALTTDRAPGYGPARQSDGSIVVCAVAVAPELRQLGRALDAVNAVERTPSNAIELSGEGHSVTLFTQ